MLILSRKIGEKIKIGDDVTLCVVEIAKGHVKLGIEAPKTVTILRQEVFERVRDANIASVSGEVSGLSKVADMLKSTGKKERR